jgi:K+-transporting ATPase ATPase A chain
MSRVLTANILANCESKIFEVLPSSPNDESHFAGGTISNPNPSPTFVPWDIATALVMIFSRYLPIVAPIAHGSEPRRKEIFSIRLGNYARRHGDVRLPTARYNCNYWRAFLPVAALGPLAEHFGPIPFGG